MRRSGARRRACCAGCLRRCCVYKGGTRKESDTHTEPVCQLTPIQLVNCFVEQTLREKISLRDLAEKHLQPKVYLYFLALSSIYSQQKDTICIVAGIPTCALHTPQHTPAATQPTTSKSALPSPVVCNALWAGRQH